MYISKYEDKNRFFEKVTVFSPLIDRRYAENPPTKEELQQTIEKVVYGPTTDMLDNIFYSFCKRIDF